MKTIGMARRAGTLAVAMSLAIATAAPGQLGPDMVEIKLSNFRFDPAEIHLVHGHRYTLHFSNLAGGGHNFVAKSFFAAATLAADDRARVRLGEVDLAGRGETAVTLEAPAAGVYEFHCSHFMHQTFGMKGRIVVQ